MKKIVLSGKYGKGKFSLVDDADYDYLNQWDWHLDSGYVRRTMKNPLGKPDRKNLSIHQEILGKHKGMEIDHINGNKLDNRRGNLRVCTHQTNMQNAVVRKDSASQIQGICFRKKEKKWLAYITENGKHKHLGCFLTVEGAMTARDRAVKEIYRRERLEEKRWPSNYQGPQAKDEGGGING